MILCPECGGKRPRGFAGELDNSMCATCIVRLSTAVSVEFSPTGGSISYTVVTHKTQTQQTDELPT